MHERGKKKKTSFQRTHSAGTRALHRRTERIVGENRIRLIGSFIYNETNARRIFVYIIYYNKGGYV